MIKLLNTLRISALVAVFCFYGGQLSAQTMEDFAVMVEATVSSAQPHVTLTWPLRSSGVNSYTVHRRSSDQSNWSMLTQLPASATSFEDQTATLTQPWEYRVTVLGTNYTGYGYILVGKDLDPVHQRGDAVLLVADAMNQALGPELQRLKLDLEGDGWQVSQLTVAQGQTVAQVKQSLVQLTGTLPDPQTVFVIGNVPVPYSGQLYPDGHTDHEGAWPTDHYYASTSQTWTDELINLTTATRPENHNVPGDGKFDRSGYDPGQGPDLAIGRVDLSNMPGAGLSEVEVTRRYLDRNHAFRNAQLQVAEMAGVDYYFGINDGEAFAANGYMNFSPLVGRDNTAIVVYSQVLLQQSKLFTYVCGSGSYTSMVGAGTSSFYFNNEFKGVFNMMFGSYFGDWDNANNLLKAPLAGQGLALANVWAGRPYWYLHQMALGQTLGQCAKRSMSNNFYHANYCSGCISTNLMGDPTLRAHPLEPISNLALQDLTTAIHISWSAPTVAPEGYFVYRRVGTNGPFVILGFVDAATTSFIDTSPVNGTLHYMVRAVATKSTASGSYKNLSTGIQASIDLQGVSIAEAQAPTLGLVGFDGNTVTFSCNANSRSTLTVIDMAGRELMHIPNRGSGQYTVDVAQLPSAIYAIVMHREGAVAALRFAK